ncbi:hypothetical protein M408DRAFT_181447 [Serendipita vermifera MAFF 305830]|uniref:Uncharacterized protein n=1 Tax=Serendipita vermifera MAFF 305830 TaxID=933852 RepID=A0A0C2WJR1_SERVB|nr:hypothetical protein M408DRAFT_181447 [Serendipita vermifera MAFF 305830]
MEDVNEEEFSRPAKRRRISQQGLADTVFSYSHDTSRPSQAISDPRLGSYAPTSPTALRTFSQTKPIVSNDEEVDIVETSDNEELLLGYGYDEPNDYATTIFVRSSSRPASGPPTSSPYQTSRMSITSEVDNGERDMTPKNASPIADAPATDSLLDFSSLPSSQKSFQARATPIHPMPLDPSSPDLRREGVGISSSIQRANSGVEQFGLISRVDPGHDSGSETESDHWSDEEQVSLASKPIPARSPLRTSPISRFIPTTSNQSSQSQPSVHDSLEASDVQPRNHEDLVRSEPTSSRLVHSEHPTPSRFSQSSHASQTFSKSPSLTPPPPSPPRRRTRESNKKFAPYTAYRQQYGDAALEEMKRLEQLEASRRLNGQRSTVVDPNEDANWVGSQSQIDEESQNHTQASTTISSVPPAKPRTSLPKPLQKTRPDVPVPVWNTKRPNKPRVESEPVPLKARDPNAPRRFVDLDGSPIRANADRVLNQDPKRSNLSTKRVSHVNKKAANNIDDDLRLLYAGESDEDDDGGLAQDSNAPFDDMEVPENFADLNEEGAPTTDPDTNGSDMDTDPMDLRPVKRKSTLQDSLSDTRESSGSGSSEVSEDDEEREIRKRQRILARVLPAVMIKKSAQQEREKELERQRRHRAAQRARREALGLGDSDPDDEQDGAIVLPGQSKTKRVPSAHTNLWNSGIVDEGVIDLTSDRESLDNDDPMVAEEASAVFSSDEDISMARVDSDSDIMELEAMEDNTFHTGARHRHTSTKTSLTRIRRGPINKRNPNLRQSRIDRMLNSTTDIRRRSKHGGGSKAPRNSTSRNGGFKQSTSHKRLHSSKNRASNTYMVTNSAHPYEGVQTKLPFEPIGQDPTLSGNHRDKPEKGYKKSLASSKARGNGLVQSSFAELFDVLAPRNRDPKTGAGIRKNSNITHASKTKRSDSATIPKTNAHGAGLLPYLTSLQQGDLEDPDAKIEISLNSALAFGMRRSRQGLSLGQASWLSQGKILDLVRVLSGSSEPAQPLPCHVSTLRLDSTTPIIDLQLQFPTVCDLIFAFIEKPSRDEDRANVQQLMRFMCLFISWSANQAHDDIRDMLNYVTDQVRALMDRVEEYLVIHGRTGKDFNLDLFSIHWFAVEISNRIAKTIACLKRPTADDVIVLNDPASDQYTIKLMTRLLEFGVRRAMAALQGSGESSPERHAAELWIALIHITMLQPRTSEDSKIGSDSFWRLVLRSLDNCDRQFASVAHETEFIFATIFSLSSLSSFDSLGVGQEHRVLQGYWPIVCRALSNIELAPDKDRTKRLSQSTLAAKDTYIGMLFARCNVLAFRWQWSLQDAQETKQLFDLLRGALKDRGFMNLLHEQSDFPYFITRRNLRLLHEFEPKDSIQTIVIKLMLRKVQDAREDMKSAKKWISLLAFTSALEFTKEKPPTQKELSTLFNQFTIKFVLLYVNPDANNAHAIINSSKKIVNFKSADHRSRLVCIRSTMILGRFCRHFRLPLDGIVQWMIEMGLALLDEHRLMGVKATTHQKKETGTLCALLLGALRDVLQTDVLDDRELDYSSSTPFYLENLTTMLGFVARLIPLTREWEASVAEEAALLLAAIFQSRSNTFPPPKLPNFPPVVVEEESQEDYGFDPIDLDDPEFTEVMQMHENTTDNADTLASDLKFATVHHI